MAGFDVRPLHWPTTAVVLVSFQNDFFGPSAVLRPAFDDPTALDGVFERIQTLLHRLAATPATIVSAPICFSEGYAECREPVGMLAKIMEAGALRVGHPGSEVVAQIRAFGGRIHEVAARRGFDAFADGKLELLLRSAGVTDVLFAGIISSVCVDASARAAAALGYRVGIIADCTTGRSPFEHDYYCDNVFPLYARVLRSEDLGLGRVSLQR